MCLLPRDTACTWWHQVQLTQPARNPAASQEVEWSGRRALHGMAGLEYYVDTQTGQTDLPQYDKWFKWAKFGTNWTTAVLALGTLVFRGTSLDDRPILLGFFVLFTLFRAAEVAKETIPIFLCGQSFAWVQACCRCAVSVWCHRSGTLCVYLEQCAYIWQHLLLSCCCVCILQSESSKARHTVGCVEPAQPQRKGSYVPRLAEAVL